MLATMTIRTVGLVGAGVMGRGLAETLARTGIEVILIDLTEDILDDAVNRIGYSLKSEALFNPKLRAEYNDTIARIRKSTDYSALSDADFIIESTTENRSAKQGVYARLSEVCRPGCVIAANTSVIPIAKLAS
jgi:3-hydroxybutyryl-CoA dehydrogenase